MTITNHNHNTHIIQSHYYERIDRTDRASGHRIAGMGRSGTEVQTIIFTHSEEEAEEAELLENERREHGFREMNIKDIIRTNSTKGFDAV